MLTFEYFDKGTDFVYFCIPINSYLTGYLPCNDPCPIGTQTFDFPVTQLGGLNGENSCYHEKLEGTIKIRHFSQPLSLPVIYDGSTFSVVTEPPKYYNTTIHRTVVYKLSNRYILKTKATKKGSTNEYFETTMVYLPSMSNGYYRLQGAQVTYDADDDTLASMPLRWYTNTPTHFTISESGKRSYRRVKDAILHTISKYYYPYKDNSESEDFAMLSDDCALNARYVDCNLPMLVRELTRLRTDTEAFVKLLASHKDTKWLSNVFLSSKYGARLTVRDARLVLDELYDQLIPKVNLADRVHSRTQRGVECRVGENRSIQWSVERVLTIDYHQNPWDVAQRCFTEAANWDAIFSLKNIWDFIPYSFVVDWFLDVEGALVRLDNQAYWHCLHVDTVISSQKKTADIDASWLLPDAEGTITATFYERKVSDLVPTGSPRFTPSLDFIHHVPELSALFRQRIK